MTCYAGDYLAMHIEIMPTLTPAMLKTLLRAIEALPAARPCPDSVSLPSYNRGWKDGYNAVKLQLETMITAAQWAEAAARISPEGDDTEHPDDDTERGPGPSHPAARSIAARPAED